MKICGGDDLEDVLQIERGLQMNPYVTQMDKISESLKCFTSVFYTKTVRVQEKQDLFMGQVAQEIDVNLCRGCSCYDICEVVRNQNMPYIVEEFVHDIEEYGAEMSVRKKRELEHKCMQFESLKGQVQKAMWTVKSNQIWEAKMEQNKLASLVAMQAYIQAVQTVAKEIQDSVYEDERLERRISKALKKQGVRVLKTTIFVSEEGLYKIHISAKTKEQICITTEEIATIISFILGRRMVPEQREHRIVKEQYETNVLVEKLKFQCLYGTAHICKEGSEMTGDNFLVLSTEGGKRHGILSDGMGSGVAAYQHSKELLEQLEMLIEGGISMKFSIEMLNAMLTTKKKEVEFATLDICTLDCYTGEVELWKSGSASTYIFSENKCKSYDSSSLPVGVLVEMKPNYYQTNIDKSGYIVMLTDGVTEMIPMEERCLFIQQIIQKSKTKNPKELAKKILETALEGQDNQAKDDMMVMVIGVWELHF